VAALQQVQQALASASKVAPKAHPTSGFENGEYSGSRLSSGITLLNLNFDLISLTQSIANGTVHHFGDTFHYVTKLNSDGEAALVQVSSFLAGAIKKWGWKRNILIFEAM
jgi:hypothetical protein